MEKLWPLIFVLFGVIFGGIGCGVVVSTRRFMARALRVPGVVVDLRVSRGGGGGSRTYRPVFRFQTYEGQAIEAVSSTGSNPPSVRPGEQVGVLYDPANPRRARLDKFGERGGFLGWLFTGFGVLFTAIGVIVTVALNF